MSVEKSTPDIPDETSKHIGVHANRMLKEMGSFLKSTKSFTFQAETSYDALDYMGQNIRYGGKAKVDFLKPNSVRSEFEGDERNTLSFYNGKTFCVLNKIKNTYAVMEVPSVIDNAIDTIAERLHISIPLADLLYTDPYAVLINDVIEGRWVGLHSIGGVPCNHLAFIQKSVDWQIWIEAGDTPVPRQILITYKEESGCPKYLARLSEWKINPELSAGDFNFTPPSDASEIEFMPVDRKEAEHE